MNSDKINYIDDKDEKDFQEWRKTGVVHHLATDDFARRAYKAHKELKDELEKIGVKQVKKCPECGKCTYTDVLVFPSEKYKDYYCDDCVSSLEEKRKTEEEKRKTKEKEESIKRTKEQKIDQFYKKTPPRYHKVSETSKGITEEIPSCSIFYGGFGTGKTWTAYEIAFKLTESLDIQDFIHTTEVGLMNEIKAGFVNNSFDSRVSYFKEVDLLIVDEMGKNNDSDFNKAQIFEILNYRYDWEKKTILICNCEEKNELYDILSPAILDRFRERIVKMGGESKRYTK